ncbi:MAG: 3-dehydroquinate synthase [Candidatus Aminicenantales bacterium]
MNIILTGMMGVGKTTVGKMLARRLGMEFQDLDEYIESTAGMTVAMIFSRCGESHFRELEKKACRELGRRRNFVIATGGKTLLESTNLKTLCTSSLIVTLISSADENLQRIKKEINKEKRKRPLLDTHPSRKFIEIYGERKSLYMNLPNKIDTSRMKAEQVVDAILRMLSGDEKRLEIGAGDNKSSIMVKKGLSRSFSAYLEEAVREKKIFILSDKKVFAFHGEQLLKSCGEAHLEPEVLLLPRGERQKNLRTAEKIYAWLIRKNASRASTLITFGGGVVSDIGGWVASTFHRGLKLIIIPTTLLSQIDASLGGKNGLNFGGGKNQIGTFYFPSLVLVDPLVLATLSERQMKEGMIEALKAGIIGDKELFDAIKAYLHLLLLKDMEHLEKVIIKAIKVKAGIVNKDPCEKERRRLLNLGHTFGHALESYFNYRGMTHGQAVGLGLICACKMSSLLHICSESLVPEVKHILSKMKMPTRLKNLNIPRLISLMGCDKKRTEEGPSFILPEKTGKVIQKRKINENIIRDSIKEISYG